LLLDCQRRLLLLLPILDDEQLLGLLQLLLQGSDLHYLLLSFSLGLLRIVFKAALQLLQRCCHLLAFLLGILDTSHKLLVLIGEVG
jgi:hypothetical protein